jgi:ABC-type spermidine/putrescine transport system permease subunit I
MYPRWLWRGFAFPGIVWLILLFIVPFYAVTAVAFGSVDPILLTPIPQWNPAQWNVGWVSDALSRLEPGGDLWVVFVRTCEYVAASLAISFAIGYPVAYYIARHASRTKTILLILLILPLWVSYLMRMLAWVNLLAPDGYVNRFLEYIHVISSPYGWLDGRPITVIMALVYGYIPYLILPLYASLDRIDKSLMEAARDLGASPLRTFLHVTLPLSKTGILGGAVLIALPMFGDYYTPNIVSGAPTTSMLGNQIDLYFHFTSQPTIGAALTLILSAFLVILMAYYMVTVARATREQRA